jgi:dihydrofolate reductase
LGVLTNTDAAGTANWAVSAHPIRGPACVYPVGGGFMVAKQGESEMGKIVVSQNVTLDGVVEDPSGEGGFRHGGWFQQFMGDDWAAWAELELAEAQGADALLMGRRSDEYFGTRSAVTSGDWVDSLNRLPKYVVSTTLHEPKWTNVTVLAGEVVGEVVKLRQRIPGEIVVYASLPLVRTLMEHDLVDELRLTVFPVVLGAGERLFGETSDKRPLRLIRAKTVGNGLAHLTYERARGA